MLSFPVSSSLLLHALLLPLVNALHNRPVLCFCLKSLFSINDTSSHTICEDSFPSEFFPKLMNWNINSDCCNWGGVTCENSTGDIGIDLPPYILNNLLLNYTLLTDLWLAEIYIGLVLPTYLNISSSLKSLDLTSTGLQGKVPDNIFNLKYLEELILSRNSKLTDPMPIVNTSTSIDLRWLDLSLTNLSGELPNSIGHLKSLVFLSLSDCGLTGHLSESLVNLRQLVFLYLSSNMLSGVLPSWLFTLPSLEFVRLSNNKLKGTIPLELFSLQSIKGLALDNNQLSGKIDVLGHVSVAQTFLKLTRLKYLDLSYNNFSGDWEFETLLSSLINLTELHLSHSGVSVMTKNATSYVNPDFKLLSLAYCKINVTFLIFVSLYDYINEHYLF
ncbi:leucine-rich repeat-containing protein [Tanacetum coccineum]